MFQNFKISRFQDFLSRYARTIGKAVQDFKISNFKISNFKI